MDVRSALAHLRAFIRLLDQHGIRDGRAYAEWAKEHTGEIAELFSYERRAGMPSIHTLVKPCFHPTLPLILLNYTPLAHNTLFEFPEGWTPELRLCRGIVFDRDGTLVAMAFPKFFNYGEHAETRDLPDLPFVATEKLDGHLGIVFRYQGRFHVTTRGVFMSPTAKIAQAMLDVYVREHDLEEHFPEDLTLLVEIIHPDTEVYTSYDGEKRFTVIGAYANHAMHDLGFQELRALAEKLRLPMAERWAGRSLAKLVASMQDRSVSNREGFVVRFDNGLRVKLKFQTYIGKMVADKLSYTYLMNRMLSGNLQKMLETLPEEIFATALRMLGEILLAASVPGDAKAKWRALYALDPEGSSYFQSVCRAYVKATFRAQ